MQNNALCQARNRVFNATLSLQLFWRFSRAFQAGKRFLNGVCEETTVSSFLKRIWCESTLLRTFAQRGPSGSFEGFNANLGVFENLAFEVSSWKPPCLVSSKNMVRKHSPFEGFSFYEELSFKTFSNRIAEAIVRWNLFNSWRRLVCEKDLEWPSDL